GSILDYRLRLIVSIIGASLCSGFVSDLFAANKSKSTQPLNVISFLADDLGYGDLGIYGCKDARTPNLDRLASEGARFTNAYAAACLCSPTRAAFVTGRYQLRIGEHFEPYLSRQVPGLSPQEHPTIAMYLKEAEYETVIYGKWNVGYTQDTYPNHHGFDYWLGLTTNHDYFTHHTWNFQQEKWTGRLDLWENGKQVEIEGYTTDILADGTVQFIKNYDGTRPFFIYVPWQAPHGPLQGPEDKGTQPGKGIKPEMRPTNIKIIERLDYQIGRILETLKQKGLDKNTLVIFSSDNGGHRAARNHPLRGGKASLYEGGIRVPLIMRLPGVIPAGITTDQMAITMDITATILATAGIEVPQDRPLDGVDLIPYLTGRKPTEDRMFCWRSRQSNWGQKINKVLEKAIRHGKWKLHIKAKHAALYNLQKDIGETQDLAKQHPEMVSQLEKRLADWETNVTPKQRTFTIPF
ncbi:MAG: sulfatase-like hydrolase/transferase, partial [Planctomycetota bacterium]